MNKTVILLSALMFTNITLSQEPSGWFSFFGNDRLLNKLNFHYEIQYRNHNVIGQLDQLLLRGGLGYSFSANTQNALVGYGFIQNKSKICYEIEVPEEDRDLYVFGEHRFFQQYTMKHEINRVLINHRYRFENRFINDDFSLRFRYFLAGYVPINGTKIEKGVAYFGAYNELFMNFEGDYYDRNRTYLALGYALSDFVKIELGYLRQNISSEIFQHFQISIFNNIDFKLHRN